jgi:hypothetical protein
VDYLILPLQKLKRRLYRYIILDSSAYITCLNDSPDESSRSGERLACRSENYVQSRQRQHTRSPGGKIIDRRYGNDPSLLDGVIRWVWIGHFVGTFSILVSCRGELVLISQFPPPSWQRIIFSGMLMHDEQPWYSFCFQVHICHSY